MSASAPVIRSPERNVEVAWFSALCGDNYEYLGVPDGALADELSAAFGSIDAFPPGVDPHGDWYDEMLISGDLIVVVGYSYERGGTEINRFRISADGRLRFVDSHHLKSNDYYSSRNFASRLIGNQLVVYTPLYFGWDDEDPLDALPGLSRWTPGQDGLGTIRQGYVEGANVDVVQEMVNLISAQRAYEINSKMISTSEEMLQVANNVKR